MIRVQCSQCGLQLQVKESMAGHKGRCPRCKAVIEILEPSNGRAAGVDPSAGPPPLPLRPGMGRASTPPPFRQTGGSPPPPPAARPADAGDGPDVIPFDSLEDDQPTAEIIVPKDAALGAPIEAVEPAGEDDEALPKSHAPAESMPNTAAAHAHVPSRLDPQSQYLICNQENLIARWQNDGHGWQLRIMDGFCRAATVSQHIPEVGKFVLIEIGVERREDGFHLKSVTPLRLNERHALTKLTRGDDAILSAVIGPGKLNASQKGHVRSVVRSKFLPEIWPELEPLMEVHSGSTAGGLG